ncbi:MAG: helix-turn-helix domain-containing protein [Propionibacteriaceae bacterium]|jgi:excisionase family DNA binding protein|nr:helix-turn-helix domain-containing protein [Propionibacteriaceae bacterium]
MVMTPSVAGEFLLLLRCVIAVSPRHRRHDGRGIAPAIGLVEEAARAGQTVVVSAETKMLTPDELARRLTVSRSTISRRISAGEIQVVKVGNRNRIPCPEARRLWDEQLTAVAKLTAADIETELFGDDD